MEFFYVFFISTKISEFVVDFTSFMLEDQNFAYYENRP